MNFNTSYHLTNKMESEEDAMSLASSARSSQRSYVSTLSSQDYYSDDSDNESDECEHSNTVQKGDMLICTDCGLEIEKMISFQQEWTYYKNSSRHSADPSRCSFRTVRTRGIIKDIEDINNNFPRAIIDRANDIYKKIINDSIHRATSRKALIFACMFRAYRDQGMPQNPKRLGEVFGLDKKQISQGLKKFNELAKDA